MALSTPPLYATYTCTLTPALGHMQGHNSHVPERQNSSERFYATRRPWLPPGVEDAFRGCKQLEPRYIWSVPGLALLYSCYLCTCWIARRKCDLQSSTALSHNPTAACLSELQVHCCFKGTHMYLILSGHVLMFFLGVIKAKTSFKLKTETLR